MEVAPIFWVLLSASSPTSQEASKGYPSEPVLKAFAEGCSELTDLDRAIASIASTEWQTYELRPGDPWYEIRQQDHPRIRRADFKRSVEGRPLTLSVSHEKSQDGRISELHCRVHDHDADVPIDIAAVEKWAGKSAWYHRIDERGSHHARFSPFFEGHRFADVSFNTPATIQLLGVPELRGLDIHTWWTNAPPEPVVTHYYHPPPPPPPEENQRQ